MIINLLGWKFWFIFIVVIFVVLWVILGSNNVRRYITPDYPDDVLPGLWSQQFHIPTVQQPVQQPIQPVVRQPRSRSKSETMVGEVFADLVKQYGGDTNDIKYNYKHSSIINPETGRNLELDVYYDDGTRKFAIEYDGEQHTKFPNRFHPDTEQGRRDFDALQRRDRFKDELCGQCGIHLLRISYECDVCDYDPRRGFVYNPNIKKPERRRRLHDFIKQHFDNYINSTS